MNYKYFIGGNDDNNEGNSTIIIFVFIVLLCLIGIIVYFFFYSNANSNKFVGKGGILVTSGVYNYHIFTKNDNIVFNSPGQVEYLIIGGGGSGGNAHGGGGGAGRVISSTVDISANSYPVLVGNGGSQPNYKGKDSSVFNIIAEGGGSGGGSSIGSASSGGSGGGGPGYNFGIIDGGLANGSIGFGNKGGNGNQENTAGGGGGGGGAGSTGENGQKNNIINLNSNTPFAQGGKGGSGTNKYSEWLSAIKNNMPQIWKDATVNGYIAAGGGGGSWATLAQLGGNGGGGKGGSGIGNTINYDFNIDSIGGVPNTGSGGGGGGSNDRLGAPGGSGLVIIRYKN